MHAYTTSLVLLLQVEPHEASETDSALLSGSLALLDADFSEHEWMRGAVIWECSRGREGGGEARSRGYGRRIPHRGIRCRRIRFGADRPAVHPRDARANGYCDRAARRGNTGNR